MNKEIRWKQRFENLEKSFHVLQRRTHDFEKNPRDEGYQMALVHSFEVIFRLSWKTLKDYLENQGVDCGSMPKKIFRQSFQAELISSPEKWMSSTDIRTKTTHIYKEDIMKEVTLFIQKSFYPIVQDLYFNLKKEL